MITKDLFQKVLLEPATGATELLIVSGYTGRYSGENFGIKLGATRRPRP